MKNEDIQKKTILVIEDDLPLQEAIKMKLGLCGFSVLTSRSVENAFGVTFNSDLVSEKPIQENSIKSALAYLEILENINAIWLDHNLIGKEDGLDFIVKFKANGGKYATLPIFVVSNSENTELIKTYAEIGVTHYYLKAEHKLADIIADIKMTLDDPLV